MGYVPVNYDELLNNFESYASNLSEQFIQFCRKIGGKPLRSMPKKGSITCYLPHNVNVVLSKRLRFQRDGKYWKAELHVFDKSNKVLESMETIIGKSVEFKFKEVLAQEYMDGALNYLSYANLKDASSITISVDKNWKRIEISVAGTLLHFSRESSNTIDE